MNIIISTINFFGGNLLILGLATCFTIIGLPLSIVFFVKGNKKKKITYNLKTNNIIANKEKKYNKLNLLYNEKEIDNFSSTKFAIWNSGNDIINNTDISDVDLLTIKLQEGIILDASIIQESNKVNEVRIKKDGDNKIIIYFDYLGKLDGIVLQIIHTGIKSDQFNFNGTIKGYGSPVSFQKKVNKLLNKLTIKNKKTNSRLIKFIDRISAILIIIVSFFMMIMSMIAIQGNSWIVGIILFLISLVYFYFGTSILRVDVPKKFDKYFE